MPKHIIKALIMLLFSAHISATETQTHLLEEVTIIGDISQDKTGISPRAKKLLSVAGAANDPLKAIHALPGVTFSSGWESHDPVIRGSAPRDNAYYIDGIPAEYIFHVFGTSIFDKNVINTFDLKAAAFTGFYNNATGGVIDVALRAPKNQPFTTLINWSFLKAGIFIESGIGENMAFYASYRRSLLREYNALINLKKLASENQDGFRIKALPADQDYQVKYQWCLSPEHQLTLSAAGAFDDLAAEFSEGNNLVERDPDFAGTVEINKGFNHQGIQWQFDDKHNKQSFNAQFVHIHNVDHAFFGQDQSKEIAYHTYLFRTDWQKTLTQHHQIATRFWFESMRYQFHINAKTPPCTKSFEAECPTIDATYSRFDKSLSLQRPAFYLSDNIKLSNNQRSTLAINVVYDDYLKDMRIEPRISWDYFWGTSWLVYLKAGMYSQRPEILHVIKPTGNPKLNTERSNHYLGGIEYSPNESFSFRTELYFKTFQQLVVNVSAQQPDALYSNQAQGHAYGVEFLLTKHLTDKWYGWASLGLSKTERTNLSTQQDMPFEYDKPLIINFVSNYLLTERWHIGAKWSLQSGGRYTPITHLKDNEKFAGTQDPAYGKLNSERLPAYHQLDIRIEYTSPKTWGYWKFYADILNAYHQRNITAYEYAPNNKETIKPPKGFGRDVPVTTSTSLGVIPSIGVEVMF